MGTDRNALIRDSEKKSLMKKIKDLVTKERSQYLVFTGLSLTVVGFTAIGYFSNNLLFQREFGLIETTFWPITIFDRCVVEIDCAEILPACSDPLY